MRRCQQQFDEISAEIKREMERFEISRVKDFKANIIKYIEVQMAHQQQVSLMFSILLTVYILTSLLSYRSLVTGRPLHHSPEK